MPELEESSIGSIQIGQDDTKATVRGKVWDYLEKHSIALDPKAPRRRISNFKGSDGVGAKICELQVFKDSKVVRIDPDKTLQEIRFRTLESGKTLLVPTPRLMNHVVSKIVPPEDIPPEQLRSCAARQGIEQYGKAIDIDEKVSVDMYIVGSVCVSPTGARIGKGGGLSDLEYAMLASLGDVDQNVPVVTMVHDCQVLDLPDSMFCSHDVPVDVIVTPTRIIECAGNLQKPSGILWELLDVDKLNHIPVLKRIRYRQWKAGLDVKLSGETEKPDELTDIVLDEEEGFKARVRGNPNGRRSFPKKGFGENYENETRKGRGDGRRGGWPNRGRYRSYRNSRFDGRRPEDRRDDRLSYDRRRNNSSERPGNRAYDRRGQNPRRSEVHDAIEGSIYVGSLPRSLRVSQFKTEVRDRKVNPLRVLWRGSSGFAFLNFKSQQDAEEALVALEGLQISDRPIKFEMAKSPGGQKRQDASKNGMGESHVIDAK